MHPIIWLCRGIDDGLCINAMLQIGESPASSTGKAQVQPAMQSPLGRLQTHSNKRWGGKAVFAKDFCFNDSN